MSPVKDVTENKIIYLFPRWVRVVGVINIMFGIIIATGLSYAFIITEILGVGIVFSILFACLAFGMFFGGVYCYKTTEVTFDHTGGIIKITNGLGPFRWGTIRVPKEQLEGVVVKDIVDTAGLKWKSGEQVLSMIVKGRKKPVNIITMDDNSYLRRRLAEFLPGSNRDS